MSDEPRFACPGDVTDDNQLFLAIHQCPIGVRTPYNESTTCGGFPG